MIIGTNIFDKTLAVIKRFEFHRLKVGSSTLICKLYWLLDFIDDLDNSGGDHMY